MPALRIVPTDLSPFAEIDELKAFAMIDDAMALAAVVAPCIRDEAFTGGAAALAIVRGAILRWHESGSGAFSQQTSGPFSATIDTRQARRGMFWPSEITALQQLCESASSSRAFAIDTTPTAPIPGPVNWWELNL